LKILIADVDLEKVRNIISALKLHHSEWELSITDSGKYTLENINNGSCPDAMILGKKLVDMSGLELTSYARDNSDIPIIYISDEKNIETLIKAFDSGVDDYMVSPVNGSILFARLKALVRRKRWDVQAKNIKLINCSQITENWR
jgi:two-component system response regulator CpxR